jgi:phospholipid N-methyltransferase
MFFPCSETVAQRVTREVPIDSMELVVEMGSGTGRISRAVHARMKPSARLMCVEKNPEFCEYLRRTLPSPNVRVINTTVEELQTTAGDELKPGTVDCLILSLPSMLVSHETRVKWAQVCTDLVRANGFLVIHQFIPVIGRYFDAATWKRFKKGWHVDFPPFRIDVYQRRTP